MTNRWIACLLLLTLGPAGCGTIPPPTVDEVVGPAHATRVTRRRLVGEGYLEVRTSTDRYDDGGFTYYRHTPYVVYDRQGRKIRSVSNHVGSYDQKPTAVDLPAGEYIVYGWADGVGRVAIPVLIVPNTITQVNLQLPGLQPEPRQSTNHWVRLPDGRIIGPRAPQASPEKPQ